MTSSSTSSSDINLVNDSWSSPVSREAVMASATPRSGHHHHQDGASLRFQTTVSGSPKDRVDNNGANHNQQPSKSEQSEKSSPLFPDLPTTATNTSESSDCENLADYRDLNVKVINKSLNSIDRKASCNGFLKNGIQSAPRNNQPPAPPITTTEEPSMVVTEEPSLAQEQESTSTHHHLHPSLAPQVSIQSAPSSQQQQQLQLPAFISLVRRSNSTSAVNEYRAADEYLGTGTSPVPGVNVAIEHPMLSLTDSSGYTHRPQVDRHPRFESADDDRYFDEDEDDDSEALVVIQEPYENDDDEKLSPASSASDIEPFSGPSSSSSSSSESDKHHKDLKDSNEENNKRRQSTTRPDQHQGLSVNPGLTPNPTPNLNSRAESTFDLPLNVNSEEGESGDSDHQPPQQTTRSLPTTPCATAASAAERTVSIFQYRSGPKFKLIHEADIQVCRLNHHRTVLSKILSSKFLRRWETHKLQLTDNVITSKTPTGFMELAIPYSQIEDIYCVSRWDSSQKYCIRIVLPDGSLLLQLNNTYQRDQWLHSINWKRQILKYRKILINTSIRIEVLLKELRNLITMTLTTTLQDEAIHQKPLEIISELLSIRLKEREIRLSNAIRNNSREKSGKELNEEIIAIIAPLLETTNPTNEICTFLCKHCQRYPKSIAVAEYYRGITLRILKHSMDFGKCPTARLLIQDYILALNKQNDGLEAVKKFIRNSHGQAIQCPHPRVLSNLMSITLAALYTIFEERREALNAMDDPRNAETINTLDNIEKLERDWVSRLTCFTSIIQVMSGFDDWRLTVAQILQPIPFPDIGLACGEFTTLMKPVIERIASDPRCDVHLMVLGVREEKESWFHVYCPGSVACDDDGDLWSHMLKCLIDCCCNRKGFLQTLNKCLGPLMLRALREDEACQRALCSMIELDLIANSDMQLQIISTLQSTQTGKKYYAQLFQRLLHLKELQQKFGPRKLTLPSKSTDADVAKLLSCGSYGNLECLSLAFTHVTSRCAEHLIKLPSLRYLNLWSTQFGDTGLQIICEHLHKLQVLNLCETPVTDRGLRCLVALKGLRRLNLNSTSLSPQTFEQLKDMLPELQECDIRYTDAW